MNSEQMSDLAWRDPGDGPGGFDVALVELSRRVGLLARHLPATT
jgi:hypothetical protein